MASLLALSLELCSSTRKVALDFLDYINCLYFVWVSVNHRYSLLSKRPVDDESFDYLGSVLGVVGLVLFNASWNQAPIAGWGAPYVIVMLILGLIFIGCFIIVEAKVAQALIPGQVLTGKAGYVLGCIALSWSSFGIW